ncbi:MAG: acetyl-CoA carboxylase biotin carboxylase subunit [Anaerolineales bacterium]
MSAKDFASLSPLLIANRGEIAVRIIRACRELGIETVAVYSEADAGALHTRLADKVIEIGPPEASLSYLVIERIIAAAKQTGAKAVHPGYGFLAENADFAEANIAAGLVWVGPLPAAMRAMGDKARARAITEEAGVSVLPGYQGKDDPVSFAKAVEKIGFPVVVKASSGGGGMGQRIVERQDDLDDAIAAARREAKHAFHDERLILEKYLPLARHVEFQILGDQQGNLVHLFERECSLQRRRQKIVEETPSPLLNDKLREEMGSAAVAAAKSVGYTNAGTVEFLVDPQTRTFYFLEMNTRLQVEHPITELVCNLDLVQWQLRIAAGESLPFTQNEAQQRGHAIECRIYAEDAETGFLPATGTAHQVILPEAPGIRVDNGIAEGSPITTHYDPLLAKIVVYAEERKDALRRMQMALQKTVFLGLTTNIEFLQDLLLHPDVLAGNYDTRTVEREFANWSRGEQLPPEVLIAAALADRGEQVNLGAEFPTLWESQRGFRLGGHT